MNLSQLDSTFKTLLGLSKSPVSVTYMDPMPAGGKEFQGSVPSGCTFWKMAQQGQVVPGGALEKVAAELATIVDAGAKLNEYHSIRKQQLTA